MGSVITMTATLSGSSAWVLGAQVDIPQNGFLEGVCYSVASDSDADGDVVMANLTFSSTAGAPGNDSRSTILMYNERLELVTSGIGKGPGTVYCKLPDIPVAVGERIFLHGYATTGVSLTVYLGLHFSFNQAVPSSRR